MDLSQLLAKTQEELKNKTKSLSATKGWNTRYKNIIAEFRQKLEALTNKYEQMLKNSDKLISDYAQENKTLKTKTEELEREIERLRSQIRQVS